MAPYHICKLSRCQDTTRTPALQIWQPPATLCNGRHLDLDGRHRRPDHSLFFTATMAETVILFANDIGEALAWYDMTFIIRQFAVWWRWWRPSAGLSTRRGAGGGSEPTYILYSARCIYDFSPATIIGIINDVHCHDSGVLARTLRLS